MGTKVKKSKKWKYNKSFSFVVVDGGQKLSMITQLYQVGIYGIINGDPSAQGSYTPNQLQSMIRKLKKDEIAGKIKDLELGSEIVVTDETGFFTEVTED